jgi:hypothetical protein
MSRIAIATALSAALISLAAVAASAAPGAVTSFRKTVTLQCFAGMNDGESLKANQTIVKNTSGAMIAKGTQITIVYIAGKGGWSYGRTKVVVAYRDIAPGATIPLGDSGNWVRCTASASVPRLDTNVVAKKLGR